MNAIKRESLAWWRASLIPSVGRQRQADLCEFESNLINNEFQASQGYIAKPYLRKENTLK